MTGRCTPSTARRSTIGEAGRFDSYCLTTSSTGIHPRSRVRLALPLTLTLTLLQALHLQLERERHVGHYRRRGRHREEPLLDQDHDGCGLAHAGRAAFQVSGAVGQCGGLRPAVSRPATKTTPPLVVTVQPITDRPPQTRRAGDGSRRRHDFASSVLVRSLPSNHPYHANAGTTTIRPINSWTITSSCASRPSPSRKPLTVSVCACTKRDLTC